jgi:hypothetical protein
MFVICLIFGYSKSADTLLVVFILQHTHLHSFKSCTEVTSVEYTWSFIHSRRKKSNRLKSEALGDHTIGLPLWIHLPTKVLSTNFQTNSNVVALPSFWNMTHGLIYLICGTMYNSAHCGSRYWWWCLPQRRKVQWPCYVQWPTMHSLWYLFFNLL